MLARWIIAFRWVVAGCLAAGMALSASAEKRAFIVGAGDYANITDLRKTVADADGYEALFGGDLGFKVTRLTNPTRAEFAAGFGGFLETIKAGDEVVFIFSGHGWSDGAENYLVMTDAPREASEYQLKADTTPITTGVLAQIKRRNPRLTFAIIDACRDYPFDSFTMNAFEKGLVRTDVSEGMLVLYAAGSRQKALDRLSNNDSSQYSVFTRVLLPKLRQTNRPLQDIARDVKDEVRNLAGSINHVQRPAYYDELLGDYCLSGECRAANGPPGISAEDEMWLNLSIGSKSTSVCDGYRTYLSTYPDGKYRGRAQKLLDGAECAAPVSASSVNTTDDSSVSEREIDLSETALAVYSEQEMAPGTVFRDTLSDGTKGPEMVVIPAGSFMMGSPEDEEGRQSVEGPQRRVTIYKPFAVSKFEVTWDEWEACVSDGGCNDSGPQGVSRNYGGWGKGNRPIIEVSWEDAQAYARWLSDKTGQGYSLLSEAQWEYAARAGTNSAFSWGNDRNGGCGHANGADMTPIEHGWGGASSCRDGYGEQTAPVGSFKPNAFGLYDMHGNVEEWVEDCHEGSYSSAPADGSARTTGECKYRVSRGGSWYNAPNDLRSASRVRRTPDYRYIDLGFRIARVLRD